MTQGKSLWEGQLSDTTLAALKELNDIAANRGQSLAQMAIAWVLRDGGITSALIGASRPEQITDCVAAAQNLDFTDTELKEIDRIAGDANINLWATSSESDNAPD